MKLKNLILASVLIIGTASGLHANSAPSSIRGDYLEARTCDVYTGSCVANAEMGLAGKEAIMVWSVRDGSWNGIDLEGLKVIAVVRAQATLGDVAFQPRPSKTVLIVDAKANAAQQAALQNFARSVASDVIDEIVDVQAAPMVVELGSCSKAGCGSVKAGTLVEVSTRCLGGKDHLCGNEETYYPPLTQVQGAMPAYTEVAAYQGDALNLTWRATGQRSAFLGVFSYPTTSGAELTLAE